jgi:hypothetical protein
LLTAIYHVGVCRVRDPRVKSALNGIKFLRTFLRI